MFKFTEILLYFKIFQEQRPIPEPGNNGNSNKFIDLLSNVLIY